MSAVIFMLFSITVIIAVSVWFYYNYISISDSTARKIEILGYIFLIVLIIWEFAIKNIAFGEFYDIEWYYLSEKLKIIYSGIESIIQNSTFNTSLGTDVIWNKTSDDLKLQLLTVDIIEVVLQILSTVCIAIGRFQELKKKNAPSLVTTE